MRLITVGCLCAVLVGGCPLGGQTSNTPLVQAEIATSSTTGSAPLIVSFSAAGSSAVSGGPLSYSWDFADGSASDQVDVIHTFEQPGRYIVRLRVTDEAGNQALASVEIRAAGSGAVAIIGADQTSGSYPLTVQFDGTVSQVPDDVVLDYHWDFGDGTQSRDPQPTHVFNSEGTFTVTLRIVTAGGLEATTVATITVGEPNASLQFSGATFATLPLGDTLSLTALTFEAWVKADNDGGTVAGLGGGALTLEVLPSANSIRVLIAGTPLQAAATNLAENWRHIAVVYDATTGVCVLYLDGAALANTAVADPIVASSITLGVGFRGKVGDVRLWVEARTGPAIVSARDHRLSGHESNLRGYWPLFEGTGQLLRNRARPLVDGTLGASAAIETADPAWSTDGPPL